MTAQELLWQIVQPYVPNEFAVVGTVSNVQTGSNNEVTCDIDPINGEVKYKKIQLQAAPGKSVLMIPSDGSIVVVSLINEMAGFIVLYSDVDSIKFLDGSHGGLVKVVGLVDQLNKIESDINDLKAAISNWTPVANDGGAALKTALATWYGLSLTETERDDVENTDITHGSA